MTGHEIEMRNCVIISGLISIILFYFLVPKYGVVGAAIATAVAISSQNILAVIFVKKRLGFNTLNFIN
jgi:O-antigen/teichoic acid export membrane protein